VCRGEAGAAVLAHVGHAAVARCRTLVLPSLLVLTSRHPGKAINYYSGHQDPAHTAGGLLPHDGVPKYAGAMQGIGAVDKMPANTENGDAW
jgi:hypothetical protein